MYLATRLEALVEKARKLRKLGALDKSDLFQEYLFCDENPLYLELAHSIKA